MCCSFKRAGQPGRLTRLLSCSEEQLRTYKWLSLMPTWVTPNVAHDEEHDDWYPPYNKPHAVLTWLRVTPRCHCCACAILGALWSLAI